MRRLLNLILPLIIILTNCKQAIKDVHLNKNKPDDYSVRIKVPDEWIEKLHRFDYSRNTQPLLTEFETIIKPDTIHNPHAQHVDEGYGRVLNPIFADLDGEPGEELVCLLGWDCSCPDLCVFKKIDGDWYLIYLEPIDTFYSAPSLTIAGNFSKNKVFYIDRVYTHGSDVFANGYSFYKLINGKVHHCLELPNENHIYGWGRFLNQEIQASFSFSSDEDDRISVGFTYNYFPGAIYDNDLPWEAHGDIPLVKGTGNVSYIWNKSKMIYELHIERYQNGIDDLTADKIACFSTFCDDTVFVKAFKRNIDTAMKIGSPKLKILLSRYLTTIAKDKQADTHEIKKTTQAGGTSFYSAERKKK